MKVLHIASGGSFCGIATYTTNLITHFPSDSEVSHSFEAIPSKESLSQRSAHEIYEWADGLILKCKDYDVIHLQNEFGLFAGDNPLSFGLKVFYRILRGLKKDGKKVAVTFHSEPVFLKALGLLNFEEKKCAKLWAKMGKLFTKKNSFLAIVHTDSSHKIFKRTGFLNCKVVVHGVIEREVEHNEIHPDRTITLSLFGYISEYKGHEFALSILDLLPSNFHLSVIGGRHPESHGEEIGHLLKIATELDLLRRVLITGWVTPEEANFHQKQSDISLAPYQTSELSASGAVTWSLTSGNPVIASNVRAFRAMNRQKECMLLCHPTDRLEWVWAIKRVVEDQNLNKKLISNAHEYCSMYSWTNTSNHHLKLYKNLFTNNDSMG